MISARRLAALLGLGLYAAVMVAIALPARPAGAATLASQAASSGKPVRYSPAMTGEVVGFRLAGVEPDGDPLDQVIVSSNLTPAGSVPHLHLIIDSYLENFKPDTTPILPDLLHPKQTATHLGGFLQGKVLLTDDAGDVLYIGSFLAEALLDNSNHAVMRLFGSGPAYGQSGSLKGIFRIRKNGSLSGSFTGSLRLPSAARAQIAAHHGARMKAITDIIKVVTVRPGYMVGKSTTSVTSSRPLNTGYGSAKGKPQPTSVIPAPVAAAPPAIGGKTVSPLTIIAGIGAILSFALAGIIYWFQRGATTSPS